jgi:hypothetical protein
MPSRQNLYDLYGPTSLLSLERRIAEGKIPTADELAAVLETTPRSRCWHGFRHCSFKACAVN